MNTRAHTTGPSRSPGRDRGSVSVFLITIGFVMIVLVGLAVDLSGQIAAQQHARDVAAQAARVGAEQVQGAPAVLGQGTLIDTGAAAAAARTYLAAADVPGTVSVEGGDLLSVSAHQDYSTTFLSIIGISTLHVTGHSTARLIRAQNGAPR